MTANFAEILKRPAKEIKAPPTIPQGPYIGVIQGQYKPVTSGKGTPGAQFTIALQQPMGEVDQEQLNEIGGVQGKTLNYTVYITEGSSFYLKQFLVNHLGLDEGDKSLEELLAEAPGRSVGVNVKNQPSKAGDRMVHFIESTFKV